MNAGNELRRSRCSDLWGPSRQSACSLALQRCLRKRLIILANPTFYETPLLRPPRDAHRTLVRRRSTPFLVYVLVHGFSSTVRVTENTNAAQATNLSASRGAKKRGRSGTAEDCQTSHILFCTRRIGRLSTSIVFKSRPSSRRTTPILRCADIRAILGVERR